MAGGGALRPLLPTLLLLPLLLAAERPVAPDVSIASTRSPLDPAATLRAPLLKTDGRRLPPIPARQTRFLLLDRRVVERVEGHTGAGHSNVSLVLGGATKEPANPLICEDRPWEVTWLNTDPDVWYDESAKVWHAFYLSCLSCGSLKRPGACPSLNYKYQPYVQPTTFAGKKILPHEQAMAMLYANSSDGIHFAKPILHLTEYNGSTANNIISPNVGGVLLDRPERNASRRWKMFGSVKAGSGADQRELETWFSRDGLTWGPAFDSNASKVVLGDKRGGDTHSNLFRIAAAGSGSSDGAASFGAVTRIDHLTDPNIRRVGLSTTTAEFREYTAAQEVLSGVAKNQTYGMQVAPWAESGMYIGSLAIYASGSPDEKVFNELAISHDGLTWERLNTGSSFIPLGAGGSFDSHTIYSAKPLLDPRDGSVRLYYSGGNGPHSKARADCIGLARFHTDGFAGWTVAAGASRGVVRTQPLNFTATALGGLRLNAVVGARQHGGGGSVVVEALGADDGSLIARSQPITTSVSDGAAAAGGNLIWAAGTPPLRWPARRSCVLQFKLVGDATVFSFVAR